MTIQVLSTLDIFIRLLLAGVLGGLIGLERQVVKKSAGFRTHVLVCLGCSVIGGDQCEQRRQPCHD